MKDLYDAGIFELDERQQERKQKKIIMQFYSDASKILLFRYIIANVVACVIIIIYFLGLGNLASIDFFKNKNIPQVIYVLLTVIRFTVANFFSVVYSYKDKGKKGIKNLIWNKQNNIDKNLIYIIIFLLGIQALSYFSMSLLGKYTEKLAQSVSVFNFNGNIYNNISVIAYMLIIAPIFEEIIFREIVLKRFSVVSVKFGVVMSALLFGLSHSNFLQFSMTFATGIVFAYTVLKFGKIQIAILCHVFINAISLFWAYIEYSCGEHTIICNIENTYYLICVILFLVCLMIVTTIKKQVVVSTIKNQSCCATIFEKVKEKEYTYRMILCVPSFVIVIVIYIVSMLLMLAK